MIRTPSGSDKVHFEDDIGHYLCNRAVNPFTEKLTRDIKKVTCLNCLARLNPLRIVTKRNTPHYCNKPFDVNKYKKIVENLPDE